MYGILCILLYTIELHTYWDRPDCFSIVLVYSHTYSRWASMGSSPTQLSAPWAACAHPPHLLALTGRVPSTALLPSSGLLLHRPYRIALITTATLSLMFFNALLYS